MKTPREWATEMLLASPRPQDREPSGVGIGPAQAKIEALVRPIEDAALDRAAVIADQDVEGRGRVAAAIRAMRHSATQR